VVGHELGIQLLRRGHVGTQKRPESLGAS
jgi:hypothetical protein